MTRPGTHGNDPRREPLDAAERELAERLARLGPHGEPPVAVDTRILAAAHAAANAKPRRSRRLPLALGVAASLVLALGLAWQLRPLLDDPPPPVESQSMDMAAAPADGSKVAAPATGPAKDRAAAGGDAAEAGRAAPVAGPDREQAVAAEPAAPPPPSAQATVKPEAFPSPTAPRPPQPAPPPAPPPPAPPPAPAARATAAPAPIAETGAVEAEDAGLRKRAAESQRHLERRRDDAPQAMQESAAAAEGAGVPEAEAAMRQAQLERIRALRDSGYVAQARDELDAFLTRWPGYPLPDDLQTLRR